VVVENGDCGAVVAGTHRSPKQLLNKNWPCSYAPVSDLVLVDNMTIGEAHFVFSLGLFYFIWFWAESELTLLLVTRRSQPGAHVALEAHLPIWRCTFKVSSRREKYICILFISWYLHTYASKYYL